MTEVTDIKFGTDGWRAIIGDTYTFANVERVAAATAVWLGRNGQNEPKVVVGYDTRFEGGAFALTAARVLASMGVHVYLSDAFTTTPAVSWATNALGCDAGIVVTASHNPPAYSGYKLKASFGGPATPDQIAAVEKEIRPDRPTGVESAESLLAAGRIEKIDLNSRYLGAIAKLIDIDAIRSSGLRIAYDAMFGSGQGMITQLLSSDQVATLHHDHNPGFHGQAPEPIERNLEELSRYVKENGCDIGLATDGDADRIGLYDEHGTFVDAHRIMALLFKFLVEERKLRGSVVKSFAATDLLDKMGAAYGLNVETTKIGFKYIASRMVEGNVLVGGEESGGIAVTGHIPERDGIYAGLLMVEMIVKTGKSLSTHVDEIMDTFGQHHAYRRDLRLSQEVKDRFMLRLENEGLDRVAGQEITSVDDLDGLKFRTEAGGWVMIRPSGTEPVLRVYSEADSMEGAEALVNDVAAMVGAGS
jgi:phosphomannomutase